MQVIASNANFANANLSGANLVHSKLSGANLTGAIVKGSNWATLQSLPRPTNSPPSPMKPIPSVATPASGTIIVGGGGGGGPVFTGGGGFTASQLYSTASYASHDLSGIGLKATI